MKISRINNFDIIRLLAALQVILYHSSKHFNLSAGTFFTEIQSILDFFPGVPIFFTISGFLIYMSFSNKSSDIWKYTVNRAIRIYPALWVGIVVTLIVGVV